MPATSLSSHFFRLVVLVGVVLIGSVGAGYGQALVGEQQGTATLEDWPRSLPQLLNEMDQQAPYLLPKIDSLALDYHYQATDTTSHWGFALSWRPGNRVLYQGNVLPWRQGPSDVRMVNVELRADVRIDGESVAEMIVAVDSMALSPLPGRFTFNVRVGHDRVFLDTSSEEARRILSQGATLGSLVVERMGFTSSNAQGRRGSNVQQERRESPRPPSVYQPRSQIYLGWRVGPRPYYVGGNGGQRTERPRQGTIGRTTAADETRRRSGQRGGEDSADQDESEDESSTQGNARSASKKSDETDDEDDEETSLRMPALGAVAAVALIGYAAGSVGLYGRGDTPVGLAAGWTHPEGGMQFQGAVNGAVLEGGSGQKLTAKALGFYDVLGARVQPAVGLGVQIDPQRDRHVRPSASIGLAGNLNPVVLYGGFDVVQQTPEVGITYNFRHGEGEEENADPVAGSRQ